MPPTPPPPLPPAAAEGWPLHPGSPRQQVASTSTRARAALTISSPAPGPRPQASRRRPRACAAGRAAVPERGQPDARHLPRREAVS